MAVTDVAIDRIKEMILSGALLPGGKLPREVDLAAQLGVSRNSLREAVRALSLVRILEVRQGDGTYVSSLEPEVLLDALGFLLEFHQDASVLDFFGVRRILEPAATGLAATRLDQPGLLALRKEAEAGAAADSVADLVEHDLRFHSMIAAGSHNPVLAAVLDSLAMPTSRARVWRGLAEENAFARTVNEHAAILQALEARDAELASARALTHIAGVEDWLRRL
ncbi:FadR family transcriptional regulator [Nakamurella antarctica]|uniref:FadR family transcriptional regulator n=1 Tax=Nakamurella antarctica TaxID=1902245 RepID=A0A3G8ZJG8_9ACTN|nr:FadR/GntR family transcriptional regulator [Nakamurella antarctica]AZI56985.1 FadR family transcriptional regulator [Nakamurella antarctica]